MPHGIHVTRDGAVLEVRLDRPKANAIDLAASRELERRLHGNSATTQSTRVAIVTGAGERFFCAGWDLKAAAAGEESDSDWGEGGFGGLNYPRNLNKPIIAAVNGIACGGGFELMLGTDIIVIEEHATLCAARDQRRGAGRRGHDQAAATHSVPRRGRIPDDRPLDGRGGGEALGPRQPRRAEGRGAGQGARDRARSSPRGRRCCFRRSSSCCATREMVPEHEAFELHDSLDAVQRVIRSDDLKEGARAFAEKRKPNWRGR